MAKKSNHYHVTPSAAGWSVHRAGGQRASSTRSTQKAAIDAGRKLAQASRGELRIHGTNGQIRNSNSYGNDPNPPKDTKH